MGSRGSCSKQIDAASKAEQPKAAKAQVVGLGFPRVSWSKQTDAASKAEQPKAAKAQVVGVGPHDK
jgi:hypothetical protein